MNMAFIKRLEISHEKRLEIAFCKNNGKSYQEIATIVGCSKNAAFAVCKKVFKFRTAKHLPRVGRPKTIKAPKHEKSLLRVLRCSRFEPLQNILLAWKSLAFEALAKNTARKIIKKYSF